ncbi:uncharacterized protein LOC122517843 [Polistes fuscatus]|uniref:uncharacterized protein LOC122517843 n=1 Tax=Polistes fuscatus TaxID=30207 RepID=UPI001CA84EB2|nr:uncharacterized protein LOC122517843 [Polistes fuscatus]
MLKGAARQFISFEREIKSWDSLKRSLIREFQVKVNSATIHKQLSKRRQQPGESSRLYIYSMQEIANQGNIEEDALIQYMADGLLGERRDKAVLYGSRTLTEFKNNIQIFDKLKESNVQGTRFRKDNQGNVASARIGRSPAIKKGHCYGCGSEAHSYRFCPDKEKGLKCFKCNNFGHIASHCNKSQQPSENKASINCVQSTTDRVAIRINGLLAYALLDTGSEVSIINSELYNKLGRPRLYETTRRLTGFVSQSDMRYEVLLGRELLKELDVRINKGRVEIRRPDKRLSEEISEGSVKSSDYGYVDTDEIDVKEPYKVRIKELIQNYKPNTKPDARTETKIKLTDNIPVCSKPRRLAPKEKKIVTQQLDEWLDEGMIQPSTSEYSSPVVVVPKKDGTYRVCIDYRKLNAKVIRDRFPMPLIEDCLDALTQGVVFSTIDLKNGFFHVKIEEDSRINYEDACRKLEITLTVAAQNGLIINWKKCKFLREEIEFLGHVVWNGSIRPSPTKIKAVQRFPEPKNRKQIQSFLGLTGYFRKFIKDYAKIARPLSDLLKAAERKQGKKEGQLQPIPKGDRPLETYHVDYLGPMTATSKAYKHILVVVDGFSKFVWLYPTKTTTARETLEKLGIQQRTFGNPTRIITDRNRIHGNRVKEYCITERVEHVLTTTGIPRGNGQVERINRIIISVLTKMSMDAPDKWYKHVDKSKERLIVIISVV